MSEKNTSTPPTHDKGAGWSFATKLVVAIAAVVLVSAGAITAIALGHGTSAAPQTAPGASTSTPAALAAATPTPTIGPKAGPINLLLVGTDTRTGQGAAFAGGLKDSSGVGNNDVTMLIQIAADHTSARVVSFPRDLMIPIPACSGAGASSVAQVNSSLYRGGTACVAKTIKQLTGMASIPYTALISFDGVEKLSTAIGGVPVCVARAINDPYTDLHLSVGWHTISGATALSFLRTRHGVGDGSDLGRINNQQSFLTDLLRTMFSKNVLTSPTKLYDIASAVYQDMAVSDNLKNAADLVSITRILADIPLNRFSFLRYPTTSSPAYPNRVVPGAAASLVNQVLRQNVNVKLTGGTGNGAVPAPSTLKKPLPTNTPKAKRTVTTITLPSYVVGQTAADRTCANGQG